MKILHFNRNDDSSSSLVTRTQFHRATNIQARLENTMSNDEQAKDRKVAFA